MCYHTSYPWWGTETLGSVEETLTLSQSNTKTVEFVTHSLVTCHLPSPWATCASKIKNKCPDCTDGNTGGIWAEHQLHLFHTPWPLIGFFRGFMTSYIWMLRVPGTEWAPLSVGATPTVLSRALWIRAWVCSRAGFKFWLNQLPFEGPVSQLLKQKLA